MDGIDVANVTSAFWRGNTARMSPEELSYRQKVYGSLMAFIACSLIAVATMAVEAKRGWLCCSTLARYFRRDQRYQALSSQSGERASKEGFNAAPQMERGDRLLPDQPESVGKDVPVPDADVAKATPEEERAAAARVLEKEEERRQAYESFVRRRYLLLCVLFILYVACSLGLPALHAGEASCTNGFFWEDHIPFLVLFLCTKLIELHFYITDPTIQAQFDWIHFMLKFLPSIFGYVDAYTDATAIVITRACEAEGAAILAKWMIFFYIVGVIMAQWLGALYLACKDETHACLMKIVHWDVCASSIALPEEHKTAWIAVNVARTFLEDIPQAVLQSIFLIKIKPNPVMLFSVLIGVFSSIKGVYDALQRGVAAASELAKALQEQRQQDTAEPDSERASQAAEEGERGQDAEEAPSESQRAAQERAARLIQKIQRGRRTRKDGRFAAGARRGRNA